MITNINVTSEIKSKLESHLQEGEVIEDVIIRLLDLDDQYGEIDPMEFEVTFDDRVIKVFRIINNQFEYFTPARKFSVSLADWNLPEEFKNDWIMFATNDDVVSVLISLRDNILECGNFMIREI